MQGMIRYYILNIAVAPREGRVSRNLSFPLGSPSLFVAPREGRRVEMHRPHFRSLYKTLRIKFIWSWQEMIIFPGYDCY